MRRVARIVARFLFRAWFGVEVHGAEHFAGGRPSRMLVVSNHQSFIDGIILGAFLPFEPTYLIHTLFTVLWYLKPLLKIINYLSIDTTSPLLMQKVIALLEECESPVISRQRRITVTAHTLSIY